MGCTNYMKAITRRRPGESRDVRFFFFSGFPSDAQLKAARELRDCGFRLSVWSFVSGLDMPVVGIATPEKGGGHGEV